MKNNDWQTKYAHEHNRAERFKGELFLMIGVAALGWFLAICT